MYITTNLINNRQYVGSHATNNLNDGYLGSGRYFLKAINKYHPKNFKKEILEECRDILSARKLEEHYIIKYNTLYPNGYNISPKGGIGFNGAVLSESTKEKIGKGNKGKIRTTEMRKNISMGHKGQIPWMKGKRHTEETIKKIKAHRKLQIEPMLGKHHSENTKKTISEALKGVSLSKDHKNVLRDKSLNVKKIICDHCKKKFTPWGLKNHQNALERKQIKNNAI